LEFSSASVLEGEEVAIMLLKRDVGFPLYTREFESAIVWRSGSAEERGEEMRGEGTGRTS
jgi:hypothetical protein